jgi:hypothetical protein
MSTVRVITLDSYPDTTRQVDLGGTTYSLRVRWNQRAECWHLDLRTIGGESIAEGIKLVTGFPLLRRVQHASRPVGELWLLDLRGLDDEPTLDELGTRFKLFYREA